MTGFSPLEIPRKLSSTDLLYLLFLCWSADSLNFSALRRESENRFGSKINGSTPNIQNDAARWSGSLGFYDNLYNRNLRKQQSAFNQNSAVSLTKQPVQPTPITHSNKMIGYMPTRTQILPIPLAVLSPPVQPIKFRPENDRQQNKRLVLQNPTTPTVGNFFNLAAENREAFNGNKAKVIGVFPTNTDQMMSRKVNILPPITASEETEDFDSDEESSPATLHGSTSPTNFEYRLIINNNNNNKKTLIAPPPPLELSVENFCDPRQYSNADLARLSLKRIEYFVANISCEKRFYECATGRTYKLDCLGDEQVFDLTTVNCNYRRNVKTCPEYDEISHCDIKERCKDDEFACCSPPQKCIHYVKRCDGAYDCSNGEDETNCPSCTVDQFTCLKSGLCINATARCNGLIDDCEDGSNLDEFNCKNCGYDKFYCFKSMKNDTQWDTSCIDQSQKCDGVQDCRHGEDELHCRTKTVKMLLCENQKQKVPRDKWCDNQEDCDDGSDEQYCN